jgi:hypothetical protein
MTLNSVHRLLTSVGDLLTAVANSSADGFSRRQLLAAADVTRYAAANADWSAALRAEEDSDATAVLELLRSAGWRPAHPAAASTPGTTTGSTAVSESMADGLEWLADQPGSEHEATRTNLIRLFRAQAHRRSARSNLGMYSA